MDLGDVKCGLCLEFSKILHIVQLPVFRWFMACQPHAFSIILFHVSDTIPLLAITLVNRILGAKKQNRFFENDFNFSCLSSAFVVL